MWSVFACPFSLTSVDSTCRHSFPALQLTVNVLLIPSLPPLRETLSAQSLCFLACSFLSLLQVPLIQTPTEALLSPPCARFSSPALNHRPTQLQLPTRMMTTDGDSFLPDHVAILEMGGEVFANLRCLTLPRASRPAPLRISSSVCLFGDYLAHCFCLRLVLLAGLELTTQLGMALNSKASISTSQILGLSVCATTPRLHSAGDPA